MYVIYYPVKNKINYYPDKIVNNMTNFGNA